MKGSLIIHAKIVLLDAKDVLTNLKIFVFLVSKDTIIIVHNATKYALLIYLAIVQNVKANVHLIIMEIKIEFVIHAIRPAELARLII